MPAIDYADYIVTSSNRLYGSIPKLPQRYPVATRYYQALFSASSASRGQGVHLAPSLLGHRVNDDNAEESLPSTSTPRSIIFKKGPNYSSAPDARVLGAVSLDNVIRKARA